MKAIDILYLAKQSGIEIVLNGDQLQLLLPETQDFDESLLQPIRENKQSIIDFLKNSTSKVKHADDTLKKIEPFDRNSIPHIPLSFSQERLWFIDQFEGSIAYHTWEIFILNGKLRKDFLEFAFQVVINRHDVLRTTIRQKAGETFQEIKEKDGWHLEIVDKSGYRNDRPGLEQYIDSLVNTPFDLSRDYMLRGHLIVLGEEEHVLVITMHHIASDGWSKPIFVKELSELYNSYITQTPVTLQPLQLQYADYAVWQRNFLTEEMLERKLAYWKNKLDGVSPLQLPTDFVRPATQSSDGASIKFVIDKKLSGDLQEISQQQGATLFMTLLAAFKALLYRYSGQSDISVGTSIADRPHDVEHLIGFFVNTLTFRSEVNGDESFLELLKKVRTTTLEAFEHGEVPFEKVVEALGKQRDMNRSPLFQVMLVLNNTTDVPQLQLNGISASSLELPVNSSKFDFTLFLAETNQGLEGILVYSTDLYTEETVGRLISHFKVLLSSIAKKPEQKVGLLTMLTASEESQLLERFNETAVIYPRDKSVVTLFEEQAAKTPDHVAVVFEEQQLTFRQLNEQANQLAHYLKKKGVSNESLVPLCIDRSSEMIIGILGILKAGAAYVPIDPEYPQERISYMLEDTEAKIAVSTSKHKFKLDAGNNVNVIELDDDAFINFQPVMNDVTTVEPNHLAYVIYTSGSTGKPKGAMIEHRNLVDYVFGLKEQIHIHECRSYALVSSISTDLGNTVLYSSLLLGGALHLFSKESINDGRVLHDYFEENGIDCLKIVPSHWKALSTDSGLLLPARMLIFGGEALPADTVEAIRSSGSDCKIINHYGPTETTIGKLLHVVNDNRKYGRTIPIGKPFSNTKVYVLTRDLALCPIGVPGELFIGGDGLARGYANNDELTSIKFIPDPFSNSKSLLYRTGDLVRYLPDGNIEFIGRIDEQVKIRGFRIELGEIESVLNQSSLVNQAVVLAREGGSGNKQLVGYVVADGFFDQELVDSHLKERLPEYMIPSFWIEMESFPLLANGKIDRRALPDLSASEGNNDQYVAPRNELESKLAEIWQDLLEVEQVGIHDNFFKLGGHSLLAIQLISSIRKQLEVDVSIGDVFDYPTIELLSSRFNQQVSAVTIPPITVQQKPARIPLSYSQERLWFIDQLEGSVPYHRPDVLELNGNLDTDALKMAFQTIINRHDVLRTVVLNQNGEVYQHVKEKNGFQLEVVDGGSYQQSHQELERYIEQLIRQPFDLSRDDMVRVVLITKGEREHILVITTHHIASDGWSRHIFVNELIEAYNSYVENRPVRLQPLALQYADYALWQRHYLQGELLEEKIAYWKQKLRGVTPLQLATDYPRPSMQSSRGSVIDFQIDKETRDRLQQLSQEHGTTFFMIMLAALKVLLYRYTGQEDICIGTPVAGRQQQEIQSLIGFFVNTLALRTEIYGEASFIELLQQVRATTLEAYEHQEVPFEKVVEAVVKDRDTSRSPVFQVMLVEGNAVDMNQLRLGEAVLSPRAFPHISAKFDLTIGVTDSKDGIDGAIEFCSDLFSEQTIARLCGHLKELLSSILRAPGQKISALSMLPQVEERQLLVDFNGEITPGGNEKTLVALFEEQVLRTPDNVAVIFNKEELSYRELNERSNQLAHYLRGKGVKEETFVPIYIDPGFKMMIAILGILKAGAAYVPIDPEYPAERVRYMLEDTGARVVITNTQNESKLPEGVKTDLIRLDHDWNLVDQESTENPATDLQPQHLAYMIYTSGTTGKPKGVMIEHRNLLHYLLNRKTHYITDGKQGSGSFIHLSYTFDASLTAMFMPLLSGKSIVIGSKHSINVFEDDNLWKYAPYDFLKVTPSHLQMLRHVFQNDKGSLLTKKIVVGGEALVPRHFDYLVENELDVEIINEYGPTEATVGCSTYTLNTAGYTGKSRAVFIGKPIDNTRFRILDAADRLVPVGVIGELSIGGAGLARGYNNQPELTREKFIGDPFLREEGARLYKTGDLARWLPDGNIEYLGRRDDQVKIRGYRIELGEIESALLQSNLVRKAVVLVRVQGEKQLIGYVVPEGGFDPEAIIAYLKSRLPQYMVPVLWVELNDLPLTVNGKVDKNALMQISGIEPLVNEYVAPRTETEERLANIWKEILQLNRVGIHDNFFHLGGHSLIIMRLISAIRTDLQVELNIKDIFQFSTISDLSKYIEIQTVADPKEKDITEFDLINI